MVQAEYHTVQNSRNNVQIRRAYPMKQKMIRSAYAAEPTDKRLYTVQISRYNVVKCRLP